jgi:hypothetical protein
MTMPLSYHVPLLLMALGGFVVFCSLALIVYLMIRSDKIGDLGPWRLDERARRDGTCRYRSMDSRARCRRAEGHHGQHEPGTSKSW